MLTILIKLMASQVYAYTSEIVHLKYGQFIVCEDAGEEEEEEIVPMVLKVTQRLLLPRGKGYLLLSLGHSAPG